MSNPNLANLNTYFLGTFSTNLTSTLTTVIGNVANSNGVLKINSILFNNYSATLNSNITLRLNKFNAGNVNLHNKLAVPANSRNYFLNRNAFLVLNEGDSLSANTDANNANVAITIGYEESTDRNLTQYQLGPAFAIEYLVVAGGGGAGTAGAGAGGLMKGSFSGNVGSCLCIVVGAGGAGKNAGWTVAGYTFASNSYVSSGLSNIFLAYAGGRGGYGAPNGSCPSTSGGSGAGDTLNIDLGIGSNQGFPGGTGSGGIAPAYASGGGGGANERGFNASPTAAGKGGNGCCLDITGNFLFYAGGGAGGSYNAAPSVSGGCGGGGANYGVSGVVNTGGGGGGSASPNGDQTALTAGGSGGSGIIIFRHPVIRPQANTTGTVTISANAGYRIYQFTGSGSITF